MLRIFFRELIAANKFFLHIRVWGDGGESVFSVSGVSLASGDTLRAGFAVALGGIPRTSQEECVPQGVGTPHSVLVLVGRVGLAGAGPFPALRQPRCRMRRD